MSSALTRILRGRRQPFSCPLVRNANYVQLCVEMLTSPAAFSSDVLCALARACRMLAIQLYQVGANGEGQFCMPDLPSPPPPPPPPPPNNPPPPFALPKATTNTPALLLPKSLRMRTPDLNIDRGNLTLCIANVTAQVML